MYVIISGEIVAGESYICSYSFQWISFLIFMYIFKVFETCIHFQSCIIFNMHHEYNMYVDSEYST